MSTAAASTTPTDYATPVLLDGLSRCGPANVCSKCLVAPNDQRGAKNGRAPGQFRVCQRCPPPDNRRRAADGPRDNAHSVKALRGWLSKRAGADPAASSGLSNLLMATDSEQPSQASVPVVELGAGPPVGPERVSGKGPIANRCVSGALRNVTRCGPTHIQRRLSR